MSKGWKAKKILYNRPVNVRMVKGAIEDWLELLENQANDHEFQVDTHINSRYFDFRIEGN